MVPVMAVVSSLALITLSMAISSMPTDALVYTSKFETTAVKLVLPVPLALVAAVLAPTMTVSSEAVFSAPVLPVTVIPMTRLSMVVCMLP